MEKVKRQMAKVNEPNREESFTRPSGKRLTFSFLLFPFSFFLAGCVSTSPFLHRGEQKPPVEPCRVVAAWNPAVVFTPDPAHDGTPTPGLAGRIYLFGPEIDYPVLGGGGLHVALFDDSQGPAGNGSAPLEEWQFDPQTFKRLQHHDPVGWGYTVFLPWGTYKPEITRIHLKVRYEPPQGFPLFAASAPMTLVDPEKMDKWESSVTQILRKGDSIQKAGSGTTPSTQDLLPVGARGKP
jgi:hypothetical protein